MTKRRFVENAVPVAHHAASGMRSLHMKGEAAGIVSGGPMRNRKAPMRVCAAASQNATLHG